MKQVLQIEQMVVFPVSHHYMFSDRRMLESWNHPTYRWEILPIHEFCKIENIVENGGVVLVYPTTTCFQYQRRREIFHEINGTVVFQIANRWRARITPPFRWEIHC